MVSQTTQASASSNKGFTLVELIVVITILAILGTIGFLSLQGYSGQSRDSKRTADLRSLSTAITTKSTEGIALIAVATNTPDARVTSANIAGATASGGVDYEAGSPNFTVLGLNASNFKDPLGSDYRVGASIKDNGVFQVAAKMEPSGANASGVARVTGNYVARTTAPTSTASGSVGSTSITNLSTAVVGLFKKGDTVTLTGPTTTTVKIVSVGGDGRSIVVDTATAGAAVTNVALAANETTGLIGTSGTLGTPVTDGGSNLPY
ncbi:MAG: type II secretion system protein [Patescibacteria group bacterium]